MRYVAFFLVILVAAACGKPDPAAPVAPAPALAPVAKEAPPSAAKPAVEAPDAAAVKKLLDNWLEAQNNGRFDQYQGLYASRLTGIRRTGPRTLRMDRAGWLKDRAVMFKRKMLVEMSDLKISPASSTLAMVTFTQTWSSGTYKDVGTKEMVVVKEGNDFRIAREELLFSDVRKDGAKHKPLQAGQWLAVENRGGLRVILADDAPAEWGSGAATLVSKGSPVVGRQAVNEAGLPADKRDWKGRKVVLYGPAGAVCTATLSGLEILGRFEPHFGTRQAWDGMDGTGEKVGDKATDADIATEAVGTDMGRVLAGVVTPEAGASCAGALWARDASLPAPAVFAAGTVPPDVARLAQARFRGLKGYREAQKDLGPDWESGAAILRQFRNPSTGRGFVSVSASVGEGCGDPTAALWALWEVVDRGGKTDLVLLTDEGGGGYTVPEAAADLDQDGQPEFLVQGETIRLAGALYSPAESITVPNFDCGC